MVLDPRLHLHSRYPPHLMPSLNLTKHKNLTN